MNELKRRHARRLQLLELQLLGLLALVGDAAILTIPPQRNLNPRPGTTPGGEKDDPPVRPVAPSGPLVEGADRVEDSHIEQTRFRRPANRTTEE